MSASLDAEHVLVVPTAVFHAVGYFQGFCADVERYVDQLLQDQNIRYSPRSEMEQDPAFKQLIPYVLFQYRHPEDTTIKLFHYVRGQGQGERRLHAKRSIGVGGHISTTDVSATTRQTYDEGMRRELEEEVRIETSYKSRCIGLINDDETEVGRVHLGVVHLLEVDLPHVYANEADLLEAGFAPLHELKQYRDAMESWSRICFDALFADIGS